MPHAEGMKSCDRLTTTMTYRSSHMPRFTISATTNSEAGVDGPGHKVGREDGRVPARHDADGEVEAYHRVHRDDQRRRQPRHEKIGGLIAVPVLGRAAPAHREDAVDDPAQPRGRAVAQ